MFEDYGDQVAFLFIYIREAHPDDGWQMESNRNDDVLITKAKTAAERRDVARTCSRELRLTMPCLPDTLDNTVDDLYAAWPERLFIVDSDGVVAHASGPGPWGFEPEDVGKWLRRHVGSVH